MLTTYDLILAAEKVQLVILKRLPTTTKLDAMPCDKTDNTMLSLVNSLPQNKSRRSSTLYEKGND